MKSDPSKPLDDASLDNETENLGKKIKLFSQAPVLRTLSTRALRELAGLAVIKRYRKNEMIFRSDEPCNAFMIVAHGLVRVSMCSALGKRLTYLLAGSGEPINLVGPFTGAPRRYVAEAAQDTTIVSIDRHHFTQFAFANPHLITNIITIIGHAVDSANSRILDMQDKKVVDRLKRVLYTLFKKYGPILNFTSAELADLAGTTTESTLRVMADLRQNRIIKGRRGQIEILDPEKLATPDFEAIWI